MVGCFRLSPNGNTHENEEYKIVEKPSHPGKISELYTRIAWVYDIFTDHEITHHKKAIQMAGIKEDDLILEVACGTGRATVEIAKYLGEKGRLYAIDLTEAMIKRARAKLEKYNLIGKVELGIGDARRLPFPDGMFDVLYNAYMFDLIELREIPGIISEFKRVLKPGGRIVLVNMSKNKKRWTLYEFLYKKNFLGFTSGGCRPVFLKPFLEEAGFKRVERVYRKNQSWFPINWLTGTEIVLAYKSAER